MGASFIAWLLSGTNVNPLPAHYYCPVCKKVEFHSEEKCGIDLPDKVCTCGNNNHKDGFGIDAFNMYHFLDGMRYMFQEMGLVLSKSVCKSILMGTERYES